MFRAADWDRLNGTEPRGVVEAIKDVTTRRSSLSARPASVTDRLDDAAPDSLSTFSTSMAEQQPVQERKTSDLA